MCAAPTGASGEVGRRADFALQPGVDFEQLGAVTASRRLERITADVIGPRGGGLVAIFASLAEREAEMDAVVGERLGCCFSGLHGGDLSVGEAVGLEIGEAPVRVAEARACRSGGAVRRDRGVDLADGLQRVPEPQKQVGRRRRIGEQPAVERDRCLVIADADRSRSGEHAVAGVVRVGAEQLRQLLARGGVFMPPDKALGIFVPRRAVAGDEL